MEQYDAIVIGAGIAGLGVAGILQSKGIKTLVLEKSKMVGGRAKTYEIPGGWRVDSGTHCVNLGEHSACAQLLKKLGKEIKWSRPIKDLMVFHEGNWVYIKEYLNLSDEETRELSAIEKRILMSTDEEIEKLDTLSLAQFIKENVNSLKIAEYFEIIGMVQTTLTEPKIISAGEFVYIYRDSIKSGGKGMLKGNVKMPVGGIGVMVGAEAEAVSSMGGIIRLNTPVREIEITHKGPGAVLTDTEEYKASIVVLAMPLWSLGKVLPIQEINSPLPRPWCERINGLVEETSASMGFTVGTSTPLFSEPAYLSHRKLSSVDLPLQVLGHTHFDETIAPPGHMIAFIGTPCTPKQARNNTFREKTLQALWETTKVMFPKIKEGLVWKRDGHYIGVDGLSRSPRLTGKYRPQVFLPEIPGLYFAGDCYTGRGIGMNSAARSAMICANKILKDIR